MPADMGSRVLTVSVGGGTMDLESLVLQELHMIRDRAFLQGYRHRPSIWSQAFLMQQSSRKLLPKTGSDLLLRQQIQDRLESKT